MSFYAHDGQARPTLSRPVNVLLALGVHGLVLLVIYLASRLPSAPRETLIPIDLTVVVQQNLNGNENEPPPVKPPEPEPPKPPEPKPVKPPEPLKPREDPAVDAVVKEAPKTNVVKRVEEKKPPKKTREERLREMRAKATAVETPAPPKPPPQNGKTGRKTLSDAEIEKLMAAGYRPGAVESLAENEEQRCLSLIQEAFHRHWNPPPWTDTLREMILQVRFKPDGTVDGFRLTQSSGDASADRTVLEAARLVPRVRGLSSEFTRENPTVSVRYKVTAQ